MYIVYHTTFTERNLDQPRFSCREKDNVQPLLRDYSRQLKGQHQASGRDLGRPTRRRGAAVNVCVGLEPQLSRPNPALGIVPRRHRAIVV